MDKTGDFVVSKLPNKYRPDAEGYHIVYLPHITVQEEQNIDRENRLVFHIFVGVDDDGMPFVTTTMDNNVIFEEYSVADLREVSRAFERAAQIADDTDAKYPNLPNYLKRYLR